MAESERMSWVDRAWWLMERPTNPMMVVALFVLERSLEYERLRALIADRFLAHERFRCRPVADVLGASWTEQADFDIDDHVLRVALPGQAGQQELEALVGELASTPLSQERPLWSFHLVENYRQGSALIIRIHHCYADGIALVRLMLALADGDGERPAVHARPRAPDSITDLVAKTLSQTVSLLERGTHYALHPGEAVELGSELAHIALLPDDPKTSLKRKLTGVRHAAWSEPTPLEEVRTIARVLGCKINDVLMATLAGALGSYLQAEGEQISGMVIRAAVPVNLRADDDAEPSLGNRFGMVFVDLPIGIRHPLERLYAVHATMQKLKTSSQPLVTLGLLGAVGSLPAVVEDPVMSAFSAKASLVASNVPGPREQLAFAGVPATQALFWVPQAGSIGIGVSMLTYAGAVQFGVLSDRALIEKPVALVRMMRDEFEKLVMLVLLGGKTSAG
jgi:diacylglycerol O-acyltransferase